MHEETWTYNILERRAAGVFAHAAYESFDAAIADADRLQADADLLAHLNTDGRAIATYIIYYFLTACYETRATR